MKRTLFCSAVAAASSLASAAVFEMNPSGFFDFSTIGPNGTKATISNAGSRKLDSAFLSRVGSALHTGVNGHTSSLTPVPADLDVTITLDTLLATADDFADYAGGGWYHRVRYNGDGLDDWRMIWLFARTYAPDAQFGYANLSYENIVADRYDDDFLTANFPFFRETETRNDTSVDGPFNIFEGYSTTWYTINGSWLQMENTFVLARVNGDTLEIGGAWGFHEFVQVPAPAGLGCAAVGLLAASRRRRA